jgi:hypothetical protein
MRIIVETQRFLYIETLADQQICLFSLHPSKSNLLPRPSRDTLSPEYAQLVLANVRNDLFWEIEAQLGLY